MENNLNYYNTSVGQMQATIKNADFVGLVSTQKIAHTFLNPFSAELKVSYLCERYRTNLTNLLRFIENDVSSFGTKRFKPSV